MRMFLVLFLYTIIFVYYLFCLHSWPADQLTSWPADQLSVQMGDTRKTPLQMPPLSSVWVHRSRSEAHKNLQTFKSWHCKIANIEYNFGWLRLVFLMWHLLKPFQAPLMAFCVKVITLKIFIMMTRCSAKCWIHTRSLANLWVNIWLKVLSGEGCNTRRLDPHQTSSELFEPTFEWDK